MRGGLILRIGQLIQVLERQLMTTGPGLWAGRLAAPGGLFGAATLAQGVCADD